MKLKYYLRGLGIGIIVTTIILAISFSKRQVEISDEQVMVRALALGMVMPEEQETDTTLPENEISTESEPDTITEPENEIVNEMGNGTEAAGIDQSEAGTEMQEKTVPESNVGTYRLVISKGDVCRVVCETLQENGVIDDAESLRRHLFELGYANSLSTGEYDVPYGLTMEEVAQIIVAGPIE